MHHPITIFYDFLHSMGHIMRGERVRYELEQLDEPTQPVDNYNCLGIWFSPSKTNRLNSFALDGVYRASVRTGRAGAVFRIRQQKAPWQGKNEAIFFTPMTSPAGTVWKPEHLYDWTLLAPTPVPPSKRRCDWSPRVDDLIPLTHICGVEHQRAPLGRLDRS